MTWTGLRPGTNENPRRGDRHKDTQTNIEQCSDARAVLSGRLHSPNGVVWAVQMYKTYSSKWTMIQWTAYVTSIWTVQMDDSSMDRLCYVNLDRPNGRRSNGPLSIWMVHWTAYITVIWTVQNYGCEPSFWSVQKYDCGP